MDTIQGGEKSLVTFLALLSGKLCLVLEYFPVFFFFSTLLMRQHWEGQHVVELLHISDQIGELKSTILKLSVFKVNN